MSAGSSAAVAGPSGPCAPWSARPACARACARRSRSLTEGSNPAAWRPARARLGVVGRAHGLDGSFRVERAVDWFAFAPGALLELGGEPRRIAARRGDDARPIVRLAGV